MKTLLVAVVCVLAAFSPASAQTRIAELDQLESTWARINDFQATVVAHESDGRAQQERHFRYAFMRPDHAKIEMLTGALRGMVAIWNGGERVVTYHHGLLARLRIPFGLHDKFVTSLRGNALNAGDLGAALTCYAEHSENVRQSGGPVVDGVETIQLVLEQKMPLHCPGDAPKDDATITKDVILVNHATHLPVRRLRYAGDEQVEEWDLSDLRVNTGLSTQDFN